VVLLPLYPQYSTTTTGSSLTAWRKAYGGPAHVICCYPTAGGFVDAYAEAIRATAARAAGAPLRLLFSAHGLPEKVIRAGDPYQAQVEATARAILHRLGPEWDDWEVCYQSRVGPLKWIGPATDEAITRAARQGVGVLVAPIAFVSEHVETLVELDHEYARLAREQGAPVYLRAPTVGVTPAFIDSLADAVARARARPADIESFTGGRWCDNCWTRCPAKAA
jgi:ferrochelatase